MNNERLAREMCAKLEETFRSELELYPAEDWERFFQPEEQRAAFMRCVKPQLRLAKHFNLDWDFLVHDPDRGALGLVQVFAPSRRGRSGVWKGEFEKELRGCVDRATYVRHLLISDPDRGPTHPYTVELVLVVVEDEEAMAVCGETLRAIARETPYLQHVGVNLLPYRRGQDPPFREKRLQRAFCWLLRSTKQWYKPDDVVPALDAVAEPLGRIQSIRLDNYRLPGKRTLQLDGSAQVHIVQGHNGSGKSSIVEALELMATGRVERLDGEIPPAKSQEDEQRRRFYWETIRHRGHADEPVEVELSFDGDPSPSKIVLDEHNSWSALAPGLHVTSFRLNQKMMDNLTEQRSQERARVFLQAFFPEERPALDEAAAAEAALERARRALTPVIANLRAAQRTLERLQTWQAERPAEMARDLSELLNEWLEMVALSDLAEKALQVGDTLNKAQDEGWTWPDDDVQSLLSPLVLAQDNARALKDKRDEWVGERDKRRRELPTSTGDVGDARVADSRSTPLNGDEIRALDAVGAWLFDERPAVFGQRCNEAVVDDKSVSFGPVQIGASGWATSHIETVKQMLAACDGLSTTSAQPSWPTDYAPETFQLALDSYVEWQEKSQALETSFLSKIGLMGGGGSGENRLNQALNEVMALFTPARWAYEDIVLSYHTVEDGKHSVGFRSEPDAADVPANLRLNTAELNLFVIALFLLCAPRVSNPLRLLVLDDPLQNMDELTVRTLARGLASMMRLWDPGWRVLLLLHGEGDLERVRTLVPAAVYTLPWLSPSDQPGEPPIDKDEDRSNTCQKLQYIRKLVEPVSSR